MNLTQPTEMQLSNKLQMFSYFLTAFLKSRFSFENFGNKDKTHSLCFCKIIDGERLAYVNAWRVTFEYTLGQSTY